MSSRAKRSAASQGASNGGGSNKKARTEGEGGDVSSDEELRKEFPQLVDMDTAMQKFPDTTNGVDYKELYQQGQWDKHIFVRKPDCNPFNMDNDMSEGERLNAAKQLCEGTMAQLAAMAPLGLRDRAKMVALKEEAVFFNRAYNKCKDVVYSLVGDAMGSAMIFHSLRPMMSKPGQPLSELGEARLTTLVKASYEDEEKEFLQRYPQYKPKVAGSPGGRVLVAVETDTDEIVAEQMKIFSAHVNYKLGERMKDATASFLYQLEVCASTGTGSGDDHEIQALAYGLIAHHMKGAPGYYNGVDQVDATLRRESLAKMDEERARKARAAVMGSKKGKGKPV